MVFEVTDLIQTNGQVESKIYVYKVTDNLNKFSIAVIAPSASLAKEALRKQISPDASMSFVGIVDRVMQVQ